MKYLRVTMPDGSKWDVPASVIAHERATYYAEHVDDASFDEELEYGLNKPSALIDWAANNMNWSDVEAVAQRVPTPPKEVDYQDGWVNGEKEIVEHE